MLRNLSPTLTDRAVLAPRPFLDDAMLDRWFEEALRLPGSIPTDVRESDDGYVVRCELPGFEASEVGVELTDDLLTIRAERKDEQAHTVRSHAVRFEKPLDRDATQAELRNGILTLTLRKSEAAKPRRIAVRASTEAPKLQDRAGETPPSS